MNFQLSSTNLVDLFSRFYLGLGNHITCFSSNEIDDFVPSFITFLFQDFEDVFTEDIPNGFPLLRGIEHQIDFVPRSAIPNHLAYRCNPEETKEL